MFQFEVVSNTRCFSGKVIYCGNEDSFDFIPRRNSDITLIVGYLNIGFDSEGMYANQVWGFSPDDSWINKDLDVPVFKKGKLTLKGNFRPGLSWRIDKDNMWKSYFDKKTGWYCIGNTVTDNEDIGVEFASNIISVVNNKKLKAIWLKPFFE